MKTASRMNFEPYRVLFLTGVIAATFGVLLWFGFQLNVIAFYPRQAHANIMYFGFLWAFVAGFLMTAIPKMTNSRQASAVEMLLAVVLILFQIGVNFYNSLKLSVFLYSIQSLVLLGFIVRRWLKTRRIPFEGFIFLPFAFLQALIATLIFFYSEKTSSFLSFENFYLLAGEAFILNLVLGLGSRLIPVLCRVPNALNPLISPMSKKYFLMGTSALVLNLGFWIQIIVSVQLGYLIRLGVVVAMSVLQFRVFQSNTNKSLVGFGLRCGLVFIFGSYILTALQLENAVAAQHLLYIGGFVLITFMVGTRVMLAHGEQNLDYETTSVRIGAVAMLFALAGLLRLFAGQQIQGVILKLGIIAFIIAMGVWSHKFILILRQPRK